VVRGLYSALPAAGMPGRTYFATDTGQYWRDNGTSWDNETPNLSPAAIALLQQQAYTYGVDTGAANAYAVTLSPAPTLAAGSAIFVKIANANTGASTLVVNGGAATAIKKQGTVALAGGELLADTIACFIFDGTYFQLQGSTGGITAIIGDVTASGSGSVTATSVKIPPGVTLTGTPSLGMVPIATGPSDAQWQIPGSGGSEDSVSGSISGGCQSTQGPYGKRYIIRLSALVGTAWITFRAAFAYAPDYLICAGAEGASVTSISTTEVQITGTGQTGVIILEGF
jgi:hypothetical protein